MERGPFSRHPRRFSPRFIPVAKGNRSILRFFEPKSHLPVDTVGTPRENQSVRISARGGTTSGTKRRARTKGEENEAGSTGGESLFSRPAIGRGEQSFVSVTSRLESHSRRFVPRRTASLRSAPLRVVPASKRIRFYAISRHIAAFSISSSSIKGRPRSVFSGDQSEFYFRIGGTLPFSDTLEVSFVFPRGFGGGIRGAFPTESYDFSLRWK